MNINFGLISPYSNFDRLYQNNKNYFRNIKKFSKFYVISLENIITPNKGVVKSKNLHVPKNFELMCPNIYEFNNFLKKKKFFCILFFGKKNKIL